MTEWRDVVQETLKDLKNKSDIIMMARMATIK